MGKVTEELVKLITKQVDERGIVVWYDPERAYGEVAASLTPPDTTVLQYSDGFFELRHRIDPFLEFIEEDGSVRDGADIPPRLVVYVPRDRGETQYALIEVEAAGVVMEPGANTWQRNTRLKVLAERVFKRIAPDRAPEITRRVDEGTVNVAELDWLSDQSGALGAVKLVFGRVALAERARDRLPFLTTLNASSQCTVSTSLALCHDSVTVYRPSTHTGSVRSISRQLIRD
ncbi:MAG: hypothetical protein ACQESR_19140 [Planctomycetota bacterium]